MKIKTFLSASAHHKLIETLQVFKEPANPGDLEELRLIKDLLERKNEMTKVFEQYQLSFASLQQLITEYQQIHLQLRKNMRLLQLRRKTIVFRKSIKSIGGNPALRLLTCIFSHAMIAELLDFDLLIEWSSVLL